MPTNLIPLPLSVNVHEYWIEHKRALVAELTVQREEMMTLIHETNTSALLGLDLLKDKLETDMRNFRADARELLEELHQREKVIQRSAADHERRLAQVQQQLDESMFQCIAKAKEIDYRTAESEAENEQRRLEIEEWADQLRKEFDAREVELSNKIRETERDLVTFDKFKQKKLKEAEEARRFMIHFARILPLQGDSMEAPRVPIGHSARLHFQVTPHDRLAGQPVLISYYRGAEATVTGDVISRVEEDGKIDFNNVIFEGTPGTTFQIQVSIPRLTFGTVKELEFTIHLMAPSEIRASGYWIMDKMTLVGRVKLLGIEAFGSLGIKGTISMKCKDAAFTVTSTANEYNEFPFEIPVGTVLSWDDIRLNKTMIEAKIPQTKFTNPFLRKFEVTIQSQSFPSFQYPQREVAQEAALTTTSLSVPYYDLVTEVALSDNGQYLATADVVGVVRVFVYTPDEWIVKHAIANKNFANKIKWNRGGSLLAVQESSTKTVRVWSVAEMSKFGENIPADASPKIVFRNCRAATILELVTEGSPKLLACIDGDIVYRDTAGAASHVLPVQRGSDYTALAHAWNERHGLICFVGSSTGTIDVVGVQTAKRHFIGQIASNDSVVGVELIDSTRVVVATPSSISVLSMHETWVLMTSTFRTPSPMCSIAAVRSLETTVQREGIVLLLIHGDGNVCVLDLDNNHVIGYTFLKGAISLTSVHALYCVENEFRVVACASMYPASWEVALEAGALVEDVRGTEAMFAVK